MVLAVLLTPGQDVPPSCKAVPHPLPSIVGQVWDKGVTHAK